MTKLKILLVLVFSLSLLNAQVPCAKLMSKSQVLESLRYKPIRDLRPGHYRLNCNVDDAIKKRMLYLLNWQWTQEELNEYVNRDMSERKDFYNIDKRASTTSKGDEQKQKQAVDSITTMIRAEKMDQASKFKVPGGLLLTVAHLGFVEARPILIEALKDSIHYNKADVELALAKLGDANMQQKIISRSAYDNSLSGRAWTDKFEKDGRKLVFIASQESIYQLHHWLDASKMYASKAGRAPDTKNAALVLGYLYEVLLNSDFRELVKPFKAPYGDDYEQVTDQMISSAKNWLIKNKGKYMVNKDYSPY